MSSRKIKKEYRDEIKILFMDSVEELGALVKEKLIKEFGLDEENFIAAKLTRFGNGEGKASLVNSVRNKKFFIVSDVNNYSITYKAYGNEHNKMPDEHFADLKRVVAAAGGNAKEITTIQTILYESRQHKRVGRESLDCALALQELEKMHVNCVTTFDAHNMEVRQAVPLLPFDNVIPAAPFLNEFVTHEDINYDNLIAISPDEGAMSRTRFFSGMLSCDIGMFYKLRDFSQIDEHGKNPIMEHVYLGKDVKNGEYLVIDDMISSGGSMIEILKKLKQKKPEKVWIMATFGLFTEGIEEFDRAFEEGLLTKVYTTNLTYIPHYIRERPWIKIVDCSYLIADCIVTYANNEPISPILNGRKELYERINAIKESSH
jgi:ribose-phosphate pyrophosphokinase